MFGKVLDFWGKFLNFEEIVHLFGSVTCWGIVTSFGKGYIFRNCSMMRNVKSLC